MHTCQYIDWNKIWANNKNMNGSFVYTIIQQGYINHAHKMGIFHNLISMVLYLYTIAAACGASSIVGILG